MHRMDPQACVSIDPACWSRMPHSEMSAGYLDIVSLGELQAQQVQTATTRESIPDINVICFGRADKYQSDTSYLQIALPMHTKNENSVDATWCFQVASNFNGLENSSTKVAPKKLYLNNLLVDQTQGPSATGGAIHGAALRYDKQPINLLSDTSLAPLVNTGKLVIPDDVCTLDEHEVAKVKVLIHRSLTANVDRSVRQQCLWYAQGPSITQVLVSTNIELGSTDRPRHPLSPTMSRIAYLSTYLGGLRAGCDYLVLTLVGGGSFRHSLNEIAHELGRVHLEYGHQYKGVYLVIWDSADYHKVRDQLNKLDISVKPYLSPKQLWASLKNDLS